MCENTNIYYLQTIFLKKNHLMSALNLNSTLAVLTSVMQTLFPPHVAKRDV